MAPPLSVGVLTRGVVSSEWAFGFRALELPPGTEVIPKSGKPFDDMRNEVVVEALRNGSEHLLFLDDDVIPPPSGVKRLLEHGLPAVSGLYYRRKNPILPVAYYDTKPKPSFIGSFQPNALITVDLVGAGCLLLQRRIFEIIPKPWFEWTASRENLPEEERTSEDINFGRKLRKFGIGVKLDTSVRCRHVGLGSSDGEGHFSPVEIG